MPFTIFRNTNPLQMMMMMSDEVKKIDKEEKKGEEKKESKPTEKQAKKKPKVQKKKGLQFQGNHPFAR